MIAAGSSARVAAFASWTLALLAAQAPPSPPQGLKVTYAPLAVEQREKEGTYSYRARLLSLAVERGEAPTPLLSPGMFAAEFRGLVSLPVRDRYAFRIEGKGVVKLAVNGEQVLADTLRPGRPIETKDPVRLKKGDNEIQCAIESTGAGEVELRLFWSSSEFAWEPIAPELWHWPADDAEIARGERLRRGQQLFVEYRCARCHATERSLGESAYAELDQLGPDLRHVGSRLHAGWIAGWLRDPRAIRADARMPALRFENATDADDLAVWLATMGAPAADPQPAAGAAERGGERFRELGCIACHLPPEQTADPLPASRRLPLGYVAAKWRRGALADYLRAPAAMHPHGRMPDFALSAEDAQDLATYLLPTPQPPAVPAGDPERGQRLAQRHGCDLCHQLELAPAGRRFRDLDSLHHDHGCLAADPKAPDFALDAEARAALQEFLPFAAKTIQRRAPLEYAERWMPTLGCTNCHGRDGRPSTWALVAGDLAKAAPLPPEQDPVAQGIPALTWVGGKLQPDWMERFVTGKEPSPRPWLRARMPHFDARGVVIVQGLVRSHGYIAPEPLQTGDAQLAAHGERLICMGEGFGCVQCHGLGDQPPVQVFERQGVNFKIAAARLRREYYMRWLLDPPRIDPDSRMPKYADAKGKTAFTELLDGDAARQFGAIWHYFRTLH